MAAPARVEETVLSRRRDRSLLLAGGVLLALYGLFLLRHAAFAAGGSDSSGYLNTARRMGAGALVARPRSLDRLGLPDPQAVACIPLGFVTGPRPGTMAPFYPVGFPAHVLTAAAIAGWKVGPYLVSPIAAIFSLLLCYRLGRDLGLSRWTCLAAAAVLAAWPVFLFQALQPMSDVVATFWCLTAILAARRAQARSAWALAAGAAFGIAVLVRPTDALLLAPLAFALPISRRCLARFAAGGAPFAVWLAVYNRLCYGNPLRSGYGVVGLSEAFASSHFPPRVAYYGTHLFQTLAVVVPIAWLAVSIDRRVAVRDRALLISWFGVFFLFFCFYGPYESFIFVRFLLPGMPALILGAALVVERWSHMSGAIRFAPMAILVLVLAAEVRATRRLGVLGVIEGQSIYPEACRWAQTRLPPGTVLLAAQVSGALEYYTDATYLRYDWLDAESFGRLQSERKLAGGCFALLFDNELEDFHKHVPGRWVEAGKLREVGLWKLER
jgi:hypothetical protein